MFKIYCCLITSLYNENLPSIFTSLEGEYEPNNIKKLMAFNIEIDLILIYKLYAIRLIVAINLIDNIHITLLTGNRLKAFF